MKGKAYAKVNIALDIVGKRPDGYHLLEMIMQRIELYDNINIKKISDGIELKCNKHFIPVDNRNLAYKAAELFLKTYNIDGGVSIDIEKNIPVAAGLAGGSADCAAVLKMMRDLYNVDVSDEELMKIGVTLGADVPYCIQGGTALCRGIGEDITVLPSFKNVIILLVKPPFGVSTKEVYKNFDIDKAKIHPKTDELIKKMSENDVKFVAENMKNLLENVTLKKHRILINIKERMVSKGALGAMMSGSGPTVFGIFDDMQLATQCYDEMKSKYNDVYLTRTI